MSQQSGVPRQVPKALKIIWAVSLVLCVLLLLAGYSGYYRYRWASYRAPIKLTAGESHSFEFRAELSSVHELRLIYRYAIESPKYGQLPVVDAPLKLKWQLQDKAGGSVADKPLQGLRLLSWFEDGFIVLADSPHLIAGHDYLAKLTVIQGTGLPIVPTEVSFGVNNSTQSDRHTLADLWLFLTVLTVAVSLAVTVAWAATQRQ